MSYLYGNTFAMPQASLQPQYIQPQHQHQHLALATPSYQQSSDAFYQDISRQLAAAAATVGSASASASSIRRRHSRSSHTPAMRIVKPSSANNSPTSSAVLRKRMPPASGAGMPGRPARPVSWHPSSTNYLVPALNSYMPAQSQQSHFATTPLLADDMPYSASYSNQTSPSTAFSPYLSAFDTFDVGSSSTATQYYSPNPWAPLSPAVVPLSAVSAHDVDVDIDVDVGPFFDKLPSPDCPPLITLPGLDASESQQEVYRQQQELCRQQVAAMHQSGSSTSSSSSEYAYAIRAPRTPPMCTLSAEPAAVSVAVAAAEEDDADAEILVGMGLYDPPEKSFEHFEQVDSTLQSYRSSLLGAAYAMPEPVGKGLKLEDSWEPPENMDDDEDDDERDAEGEEQ